MDKTTFASIFASEMATYLQNKVSSGYKEKSFVYNLRNFDRFCQDRALTTPSFTRELADEWIKRRKSEASTTHLCLASRNYIDGGADVFLEKSCRQSQLFSVVNRA